MQNEITLAISKAVEEAHAKKQKARRDKSPRNKNSFWPSSASVKFINEFGEKEVLGSCLRSQYWSFMNEPETNPANARTLRIWHYGNAIEDFEIEGAKEAGILESTQDKFKHKIPTEEFDIEISGKVDGIYEYNGQRVGIEYKSGYGPYFRKQQLGISWDGSQLKREKQADGTMKDFRPYPKDSNLLQVMIYLDHYSLDQFILIYLDRGDGAHREFEVRLDENGYAIVDGEKDSRFNIHDIYDRFIELRRYIRDKQLPPPDFEVWYNKERVEELLEQGRISNKAAEGHSNWSQGKDWMKNSRRAGYFLCNGYCPYEKKCKALVSQEMKENDNTFYSVTGEKVEKTSTSRQQP